jgi:hypothetical protein
MLHHRAQIARGWRSVRQVPVARWMRSDSVLIAAFEPLDYLETRADMDTSRFAYFGFSWGSNQAPINLGAVR